MATIENHLSYPEPRKSSFECEKTTENNTEMNQMLELSDLYLEAAIIKKIIKSEKKKTLQQATINLTATTKKLKTSTRN